VSKSKNGHIANKKYLQGGLDSHACTNWNGAPLTTLPGGCIEGYEKAGYHSKKTWMICRDAYKAGFDKKVRSIMPWASYR